MARGDGLGVEKLPPYLFAFISRFIATVSERSDLQYSFHAALLASSAGAVLTVKRLGSRPFFTWFQVIGIDTGAPFRARGESGATAVAIRSLRR